MPFKTPHPLYQTWQNMKQRCTNPRSPLYRYYGGKGVTVCARWLGDFAAFAADMGPKPSPRHSLDRIDPAGNYEPSNCRWATRQTQNRNQRWTRYVSLDGERFKAVELAELSGTKTDTIMNRAERGLPLKELLSAGSTRDRGEWSAAIKAANAASAASKRQAAQCQRGHEFTPENTQLSSAGRRRCKACTRMRAAKYRRH